MGDRPHDPDAGLVHLHVRIHAFPRPESQLFDGLRCRHGVAVERENKKLIYSYELKVPGRGGVEEVNVDATTGKVVSAEHESPAAEKKEQAKDKAKAPVKKP